MSVRAGSIVIEAVEPAVDGGRHAVKRTVGDPVLVKADIYKEGHDVLTAAILWRQLSPAKEATGWSEAPLLLESNDRWTGSFELPRIGRYAFTIEAWTDDYGSWASEVSRKVAAGQDVSSELLEGAAILRATAARAQERSRPDAERLLQAEAALRKGPPGLAAQLALDPGLVETAARHPDRTLATRSEPELEVLADRPRAEAGAWYEMFPRSASRDGLRHGTFQDAQALLPEIAELGFDVVYLPPIHPIGRTARKGKDNAPRAEPGDVGSPWAIGSQEGGHKSVHPELGTLEDFRRFVEAARSHGLEVALDLAFQCSPDHPYLKEHPEWFLHRPDGSIKTAENPPKRYEDIVNFNWLGPAREALWRELEGVVLFWLEQGVRIFRVDNPHTKPVRFWIWLLRRVHDEHPDAVFLAEAFTRPKMMKQLAKVGFNQSYTYFAWRTFKRELQEYLEEISRPPVADYFRGSLWPNTPDILPEILQNAPPSAFKIRLALAATLSSSYGIYSGYELCEGRPLPGKEEYARSEKYELKAWDPTRPGNIREYVGRINRIRKANPALLEYRNLRFFQADNDRVLFYGKSSRAGANQVLVAVSLDPYESQQAVLHVPLAELGISGNEAYQVHELTRDQRALWQGPSALAKLTPEHPAAIWRVLRFRQTEHSFDYYG